MNTGVRRRLRTTPGGLRKRYENTGNHQIKNAKRAFLAALDPLFASTVQRNAAFYRIGCMDVAEGVAQRNGAHNPACISCAERESVPALLAGREAGNDQVGGIQIRRPSSTRTELLERSRQGERSSSSAIQLSPSQIRTCGLPAYGSSRR
jgi:hypothetical protein